MLVAMFLLLAVVAVALAAYSTAPRTAYLVTTHSDCPSCGDAFPMQSDHCECCGFTYIEK
jgi:hypothetical protein